MGEGLVYLPKKAHEIVVPKFGIEGGYGEICKVRISRMENIPTIINFVRKMSNVAKEKDK